MMDSQGRLVLGKDTCDKCNFYAGEKIKFKMVGKMKYQIVPTRVNVGETVADAEYKIDDKYRIFVPASIRKNYTKHTLITCDEEGNLYLNFFEFAK